MKQPVYVIDIVRTPVGKFGGTLAAVRPDDLAAHVILAILKRNPHIDPALIDEVILGAANQAGEDNRNVARMASLLAGIPTSVPGYTVNRLCASGLQSIMNGAMAIASGQAHLILAGGTESMTRAPFVMAKAETAFARTTDIHDTTIGWRFTNPALSKLHHPFSMGETAENVAEQFHISREDQDQFAYETQLNWKNAQSAGHFNNEIAPVAIPQRKGDPILFAVDEHPRLSEVSVLASLKPAFRDGGTVTAGNSSGINDGAAVSILASEEMVKQLGLKPMARVAGIAAAGVDPSIMGIGPVPASQKALKHAGITVGDLGVAELNEAFASQVLASMRALEIDRSIVNPNGGSIAIGHPLGASGTRISATLLHHMQRNPSLRYGLATMCIGVGQGCAIVYENC
ncbi:MAG: acetyl-CoA C-acyltransferase [Bacteroidia bacterium]|jgi:acetyl-CoA C-acetyltransferase|nr:acetyl-CoA C-acyltransferase [Bacteroidota bacterium]